MISNVLPFEPSVYAVTFESYKVLTFKIDGYVNDSLDNEIRSVKFL